MNGGGLVELHYLEKEVENYQNIKGRKEKRHGNLAARPFARNDLSLAIAGTKINRVSRGDDILHIPASKVDGIDPLEPHKRKVINRSEISI